MRCCFPVRYYWIIVRKDVYFCLFCTCRYGFQDSLCTIDYNTLPFSKKKKNGGPDGGGFLQLWMMKMNRFGVKIVVF